MASDRKVMSTAASLSVATRAWFWFDLGDGGQLLLGGWLMPARGKIAQTCVSATFLPEKMSGKKLQS